METTNDVRKELGKIDSIKVGLGGYQDVMFGVSITLTGNEGGWGVGDFKGVWGPDINIDKNTKWTEAQRADEYAQVMYTMAKWCKEAKVQNVADLKGKPVEVTFQGNTLKSWRLLTEVL